MSKLKFWLITFLFMFGSLIYLATNYAFSYEVETLVLYGGRNVIRPMGIEWTIDSVLKIVFLVLLGLANIITLAKLIGAYRKEFKKEVVNN